MATRDAASGLVWYKAESLTVEGRGWTSTKLPFHRLPAKAEGVVRPELWDLGCHSAGISIRFLTDAASLAVKWSAGGAMDHMPATGVSGLDLYLEHEGAQRYLATARPEPGPTRRQLVALSSSETRLFTLNLSLYNTVRDLELGVPPERWISPAPLRKARPLLFYGSSITQGGCASRPGMAYTAIVSRTLNMPSLNFGFSGNGRLDAEIFDLIAEQDPCVYVIDCLPNCKDVPVEERLEYGLRRLASAHPGTPILLVDKVPYASHFISEGERELKASLDARQRKIGLKLRKDGVNVHFLGWNASDVQLVEASVDTIHPTDLGFALMSKRFSKVLKRILSGRA